MLAAAIERLAAYRQACGSSDLVDRGSRLTVADLDLILERLHLEAAEWRTIDPAIRELCD